MADDQPSNTTTATAEPDTLTLRDQFAMAALVGAAATANPPHIGNAARNAYLYADAMLEARGQ